MMTMISKASSLAMFLGLCICLSTTMLSCGDDDVDDPIGDDDGDTTETTLGSAQILYKTLTGKNTLNNYFGLVVLSTSRDSMSFFQYGVGKVNQSAKQKPFLKGYDAHKGGGRIIDTFYTRKGVASNDNRISAAVELDLEEGTYYVHVLDGALRKAVLELKITADKTEDDVYIAEVQPLSHIRVQAKHGIKSEFFNDCDVRLYGLSSDTLNKVLTGSNPSEISIEPYFRGSTSKRKSENGNTEEGVYFFLDVPVRDYYLVGYIKEKPGNQNQEYSAVTGMKRNILSKVLLEFQF